MTKGTFIFMLGLVLIAVPYLGIPGVWKHYMYIALGVLFVLLGYSLRRARYLADTDRGNGERGGETFIETTQNLFGDTKVE
jgi:membrane protein implicated in regulation of membrane protease activity